MALCPYCEKEVTMETLKMERPKKLLVMRNVEMAVCPHCNKVLGVVAHVV